MFEETAANEQVHADGTCDRSGDLVIRKNLEQWFFRITDYADELLDEMDLLEQWPERVLTMQRNWIGRSQGARVTFRVDGSGEELPVFTTRPDTLFGATYMVLAPEHALVDAVTTPDSAAAPPPPKSSIDVTINCVQPWVMIVRDIVRVMALVMISGVLALRILRKFSRIRSNTTTDSFTE